MKLASTILILTQLCLAILTEDTGIVFNYKKQVLLAHNFLKVSFIAPYPRYELEIDNYLANASVTLDNIWNRNSTRCKSELTFTKQSPNYTEWLIDAIKQEHIAAQTEVAFLRNELDHSLATMKCHNQKEMMLLAESHDSFLRVQLQQQHSLARA